MLSMKSFTEYECLTAHAYYIEIQDVWPSALHDGKDTFGIRRGSHSLYLDGSNIIVALLSIPFPVVATMIRRVL